MREAEARLELLWPRIVGAGLPTPFLAKLAPDDGSLADWDNRSRRREKLLMCRHHQMTLRVDARTELAAGASLPSVRMIRVQRSEEHNDLQWVFADAAAGLKRSISQ